MPNERDEVACHEKEESGSTKRKGKGKSRVGDRGTNREGWRRNPRRRTRVLHTKTLAGKTAHSNAFQEIEARKEGRENEDLDTCASHKRTPLGTRDPEGTTTRETQAGFDGRNERLTCDRAETTNGCETQAT